MSNQENRLLEVGDVLYKYSTWHGLERHEIKRVTAKRAFSENGQFVRDPDKSGNYKIIAGYSSIQLATEKEHEEYRIQSFYRMALSKISRTDFSKLSEYKLTRIIAIIDETNTNH